MTIAPAFLIICNTCGEGGTIPGFATGPGQFKIEMPPGWTEKSPALQVVGQPMNVTHTCSSCMDAAAKKLVTP